MVHWKDYCDDNSRGHLLSYQIKKLTVCIEILAETETNKPTTLYRQGKKGLFRSRPFAYNPTTNMYEQR